jgi:hypothetical protein
VRWLIGTAALLAGAAALLILGPHGRRTVTGFAEFLELEEMEEY